MITGSKSPITVSLMLIIVGAFDVPGIDVRYKAKGCHDCTTLHEDIKALTIESIKEQILNKLGFDEPPNVTAQALPKIPQFNKIWEKYGDMQGDQPLESGISHYEEIDEHTAKTETVFVFMHRHERLRHSKGSMDVLHFKFSDKVLQHHVTRAELSLWLWGTGQQEMDQSGRNCDGETNTDSMKQKEEVTVTIYKILQSGNDGGGPALGPPLVSKHPRPICQKGGWMTIEIRKMVSDWFRHPRENQGLAVQISLSTGSSNHRRNIGRLVEFGSDTEYKPYIEVQTRELDSRKTRIKRNMGLNCDETSQEVRCCRYNLTVDFAAFGWDWVIAPQRYEANYCSGDCPMAFLMKYPNTHIVSLAKFPNTTGRCCTPRKLAEITMLYFDHDFQILYTRVPGMVVEKCGCS